MEGPENKSNFKEQEQLKERQSTAFYFEKHQISLYSFLFILKLNYNAKNTTIEAELFFLKQLVSLFIRALFI